MLDRLTKTLLWIGGAMIVGAVLITAGDVIARKAFSVGFLGLVDVTQLAVLGFAFLALPRTFLVGGNIAIELYDSALSPRADAALRLLAATLSLAFLVFLAWFCAVRLERVWSSGLISQNIGIPTWMYWSVFLAGIVGSAVVCTAQAATAARGLLRPAKEDAGA